MTRTFKHSGDLGDIIFALPTVRAMGGGILYLDPQGGLREPLIKATCGGKPATNLTAATIERIKPLLARVPYITEVRHWDGEPVDVNLDLFRAHMQAGNICDMHLAAFKLPFTERDRAWLQLDDPLSDPRFPIIVSRSVRYTSNYLFWVNALPQILNRSAFVGMAKEHDIFEYTFNVKMHFWDAPNILDLARVIAGSQQFICNPSLPHALAEAMKKNLINEYFRVQPTGIFQRPGAQYV